MSSPVIARKWHQSWKTVILLFVIITLIQFTAAFLKSILLSLVGMTLYPLTTLALVRKDSWKEIGIREISSRRYAALGVLWGVVFAIVSSLFLHYLTGFSTANYLVIMARQQLSYGAITKHTAWQYFPIALVGFCTLSPVTEELFFRGMMLSAFERRFSKWISNLEQGLLFGFVHLAYLWLTEFNAILIVTMIPVVTVAGCLYGWVKQRTGSVFASMIVHSVVNGLLIVWVYEFIIPVLG